MYEVGQLVTEIGPRAQTTFSGVSSAAGTHPHLRVISKPDLRQLSHFHPAWLEN